MQTGRFPPTDGGQGAAGQEEENEKDEHQHGDAQQFQREHPLLLLLFAVSGEDANGGRAQSAAFQQPPCQNAGRRRDGLRKQERTFGLSLLGRTVRRQATVSRTQFLVDGPWSRTRATPRSPPPAPLHGRLHVTRTEHAAGAAACTVISINQSINHH